MLQINPSTDFPIVRVLTNPADVAGYFVQATIRNSLLQTIIATVNLTDLGSGYFKGTWHTSSSEGIYVDITTKVYSNSGYTVASEVYGSENNQYLSATRWGIQFGNGGGGESVSYKKIEEIVKKYVVEKGLTMEEMDGMMKPMHAEVKSSLRGVFEAIKGIIIPEVKIPEQKVTDLSPVLESIANLSATLSAIEAKEIDTSAVESVVQNLGNLVVNSKDEVVMALQRKDLNEQDVEKETMKQEMLGLQSQLSQVGEITKGAKKTENLPSPFDLRAKAMMK